MGFEVLAFESGLFECDRANELLRKGEPEEAARASVFGIWRNAQSQPAFDYMAEKARSERPLLLAGFDCRASGALAGELWTRLAAFLAPAAPVSAEDLAALRRLDALMDAQGDGYRPPEKDLAPGLDALARVRSTLESVRARLDAAEAAFFARCIDNWKAREAFERAKSDKSLGEHGTTNLRDAAMAGNLRWLAEVRHPGKKIVCWAATFHLARGLAGVEMEGNSKFYEGCRNMGQATHETFGKACYTLGMVAWGGKCGSFGNSFPLDRPKEGSVEDLLHRYGEPFLFVDLRREGPFAGRMRLSPMSHSRNIEARWPEVLDGVLFIDEMAPAR
jgi:erythromycin esterase